MIPILIAYGTGEGQTAKIARFMASVLNEGGYRADVVDTASVQVAAVQPVYTAVILGGSVHAGHHAASLAKFVETHGAWLKAVPLAFFSVSLTAAHADETSRAEAIRMMNEFLVKTGLAPVRTCSMAGALRYSRYGFVKRLIMRRIARKAGGGTDTARDFEYTDWGAIRQFTLEFARDFTDTSRRAA